jgi:hypothetical protein
MCSKGHVHEGVDCSKSRDRSVSDQWAFDEQLDLKLPEEASIAQASITDVPLACANVVED